MFNFRKSILAASLLGLGCFLLAGSGVVAAGKKQEEKKKSDLVSKFVGKTIELKLKDGKATQDDEFDEKDLKALGRFHYKVFTVQLEKGKIYRIDHKGAGGDPQFDPYLILEDQAGNQLDFDDDGGGGLDSRIVYKAVKTGTHRIVTTTFVANQTGKFTLSLSPPSPAEAKLAELMYRVSTFASLSAAERKTLVADVGKQLSDKDGNLTLNDMRIVAALATEAESEDVNLARQIYKDGIKHFSAARDEKISAGVTAQFERTLKSLEIIGTVIEISGKTTAGKDFDVKNLKGKVVLVDFWATWCGPCIQELPNMEKAYAKYHGKGFDIIGVSLDRPGDDEKLSKFMEGRKMPWPCINIEDSRKLADHYKVQAIPYPLLIDRNGRVVSFRARGPQLDRLLEKLLTEKK